MLYASFPKTAGDSLVAETRTHNASSPAFKKRVISRLPLPKSVAPLLFDAADVGTTVVDAAFGGTPEVDAAVAGTT